MSRDDIDHIPTIVPSRDSEFPVSRRSRKGNGGSRPTAPSGGGMGMLARLLLVVSLVVAAVACAWAWQLQQESKQAGATLEAYESRISDLEDRLSDTDEGMSQNAAVQAAKIRELDSEVRKLWDNVWKQSKARLAKLEASSKSFDSRIAANEKAIKSVESKAQAAAGDLAKLKNVAGDLDRLMSSAKTNQAEVERVADTLNRINLDLAKLNRQVQSNEEGVRATDAFRRQISASIAELESAIRILQAAP